MSKTQIYYFNIFYLFIIIVLPSIKTNFLSFDGAGRIEILFTFIAIIVNFKNFFKAPKAMYFWLAWVIYCVVSIHYKGYGFVDYPYNLWLPHKLIIPIVAMMTVYSAASTKYDEFIRILFIYILIYAVIGTAVMSLNASALKSDYGENTLSNGYLNSMIVIFPISALLFKARRISSVSLSLISFMIFYGIILSGERKALAGLFIMLFGFFLSNHTSFKPKSVITLILLTVVAYYSVDYAIENTQAGARLSEDYISSEYQDNLFLKLVGNRALMYVEGFNFFLQDPLTGLGLTNFISYSIESRHILHTEYMVQLAECGIIGSFLFLMFYGSMIVRLIKAYLDRSNRAATVIYITTLLAILVIAFTGWIYDSHMYFIFYGLLFAYCDSKIVNGVKRTLK